MRTDPRTSTRSPGALEKAGLELGEQSGCTSRRPRSRSRARQRGSCVKLMELLEDNDDVQNVWANADISERELEHMGA